MHLPVEDDADFADEIASEPPTDGMDCMQMIQALQQKQNLIMHQQQGSLWDLHSQEGTAFVSAAYERHAPQDLQNASISAPASVPPTDQYASQCSRTAFQDMVTHRAQANGPSERQLLAQQ
ncbi:hypothetical protein PR003_g19197 [Phytophthora rubi]|uniref:Uncharacterized protein n=1 Tax=Phytophthora rubi TaxID=129364 RepID=A0A6A3KC52_9STRA|nr:hypothetical protein PR002_g18617 [Phytophthora rubi]KAE9003158.1 hypothetical protein PR001_g18052 [Phytophthora rubi]KAE9314619.1 hypothetical protein PR003_g19197 [Phytophthora rubi]